MYQSLAAGRTLTLTITLTQQGEARDGSAAERTRHYVKLRRKKAAKVYAKGDIWIVSSSLSFDPRTTFVGMSTFYGPNQELEIELNVLAGAAGALLGRMVHAIHCGNFSGTLSQIENMDKHIVAYKPRMSILPLLLHGPTPSAEVPRGTGTGVGAGAAAAAAAVLQRTHRATTNGFVVPSRRDSTGGVGAGDGAVDDVPIKIAASSRFEIVDRYIEQYHLNPDQSDALRKCTNMLATSSSSSKTLSGDQGASNEHVDSDDGSSLHQPLPPALLIHGVFGSGKSYFLAVLILAIMEMVETSKEEFQYAASDTAADGGVGGGDGHHIDENSDSNGDSDDEDDEFVSTKATKSRAAKRKSTSKSQQNAKSKKRATSSGDGIVPFKILISSTTNVAVDRILNVLLEKGFDEFVRVGSAKKISKDILPFSTHGSKADDKREAQGLQAMLQDDLSPSEKAQVQLSIDRLKKGENLKRMASVHVIGATLVATTFDCLNGVQFPMVLLDEACQQTEASSLLALARFDVQRLVLVGDPMQLGPTIEGGDPAHNKGLEQTMFHRLGLLGVKPIMLRTQYRCHPAISSLANTLIYQGTVRVFPTEIYTR
jgi:hypothetical protein